MSDDSHRILKEVQGILGDTSTLAGKDTPSIDSHRILDYLEAIKSDTTILVGGGTGGLTRNVYIKTAEADGVQTYTIPEYSEDMIVDVYLNGFLLIPTTEYTIDSSGVITTVNSVKTGGVLTILVTTG